MNSCTAHAILKLGRLVLTRAATIEMCLLTHSQETFSLSGGQSRCVEGHEDVWLNRLAPLALRTVQPMHSPLPLAHPSQLSVPPFMFLRRIWALRRLSHPPAKPPCRFIDRQGSWFEPTWRDGGVEPSTPS